MGLDLTQVIQIQIVVKDSVEATDTLRAHATAFTAGGDSVAASFVWAGFDTTLVALDSTSGRFVGRYLGTGRIQAKSGNLRTDPITIRVTPAADTITAAGATHDTIVVSAPDSLSDTLAVVVQYKAPALTALSQRPVVFTISAFPPNSSVTLVPDDTSHAVVTTDTVATDAAGTARIRMRFLGGGALPDSVTITAAARRAVGTAIPGSPISFVVRIAP